LKNLSLVVLLLGFFYNQAVACSCPVKSFNEYVKDADEIYFATLEEAKVIRVDPSRKWPFIQGRFEVRRTFKGASRTGEMMLQTGMGGGDCGVPMSVSQTYIIFKKAGIDGIHDCDGSHGIYRVQEEEVAAKVKAAMSKRRSKK
jgi:hypothetical protein